MDKPDFRDRAGRAKANLLLSALVGQSLSLRHAGTGFVGLCPFHLEKSPSFHIDDRLARFRCFGCGASGDAIDWLVLRERVTPLQALLMLEDQSGFPLQARESQADDVIAASPSRPTHRMEEDRARKTAWARRLWSTCQPLQGSPAEAYLRSRGITVEPGPALAFHSALRHPATKRFHPALIAAVTDGGGRISGIHRTFLLSNGTGKADVFPAKMMAGVCMGRCVRFGRPGETSGHILAIGEGIETSLSVRQATGLPVWAALSLSNMDRVPVPQDGSVREIVLLADADEADRAAADDIRERAAEAYGQAGFTVRIARPPEGTDFNDVLRAAGPCACPMET
jgi:phage/plasmid primase-like uncharacterized protein